MFIDYAKIFITSGAGGNGCISFRREKYVPKGGPNGGDGGNGGDVVFRAFGQLSTLIDFTYKRHHKGGRGVHGMGGDKNGKNGKDELILVPCGSVVKNFETGEVIAELLKDGEEKIILKGGRGGKGNTHFKTSLNRTPRFAQTGEKGLELTIVIELKLIADIGLVGFPNAGKSTLISKISSAKPKIADYPFTTLKPNLGIIKYHDYDSFVMADIPGIIEGASSGKGLGIQFLRHIERTRILLFLIDATQLNPDGTKLLKDYKVLLKELENYEANLLNKPRIICFTKTDAIGDELKKKLKSVRTLGIEKISISSVTGDNLAKLKDMLWTKLKRLNKDEETLNSNIK